MEVRDELTSNEAGPNLGPLHEIANAARGRKRWFVLMVAKQCTCPTCSAPPSGAVKTAVLCLSAFFSMSALGAGLPSSATVLSRIIAIVAKSSIFASLLEECAAFVGTTAHSSCVLTYPLTRLLCRSHREGSLSQSFASLGLVHILSIPTAVAILAVIMTVGIITPPGVPASHSRPYASSSATLRDSNSSAAMCDQTRARLSSAYSDEWIKKNAQKL
ncbi:hypothetical protein DFH07DRAFT_769307 [Mycena maculata]|uniref:Uncharacterized protein n=1 Tax=Mycena maculata TaxID=230809 RepID=A0AAD7JMI3_9AGAR|nr:hypothetical protein DFH07DRAFT_769307 [Mycena maculata]